MIWHRAWDWDNTLALPAYFTLLSVITLVLHALVTSRPLRCIFLHIFRSENEDNENSEFQDTSPFHVDEDLASFQRRVTSLGGLSIFLYRVLRFISCLALFGLTVYPLKINHVTDFSLPLTYVCNPRYKSLCELLITLTR